jgi:antitoxin YefM
MDTISYTSARNNLAKTMKHVCNDHAPVIITRSNFEPVVLISLKDFESMEATFYLLRSPKNAARLSDAIDEIEATIAQQTKDEKGK